MILLGYREDRGTPAGPLPPVASLFIGVPSLRGGREAEGQGLLANGVTGINKRVESITGLIIPGRLEGRFWER